MAGAGADPAQWRGHLSSFLRRQQKLVKTHHATLPFEDVPVFLMALRERQSVAAWALTAARMGEVLGTTWDEVDLVQPVPSRRMKAGRTACPWRRLHWPSRRKPPR